MYETMTSVNPPAPATGVAVAAGRQPFPVELEAEFNEMQAAAPVPSSVPAVTAVTLGFNLLLVSEPLLLHLAPPLFAVRGLGSTAAAIALLIVAGSSRTRNAGRHLALALVPAMVLALLCGVSFDSTVGLLGIQSGAAALVLAAGVLFSFPFSWSVLLGFLALLADATALAGMSAVPAMVRVESLWAPAMATAFTVAWSWMRLEEARRNFLWTRQAAFAEIQAAAHPGANHLDEVTGIANRTAFDMRLRAAWEHAASRRNSVALLAFSIDGFAQHKKQHGQRFGDLLQTQVATTLKHGLRRSDDMVARFDAQHFVVMLPGVGLDGATQIAERLRGSVEESSVYMGSNRHRATVTVGVVSMRAKRGVHRDQLVESSLNALEQAKGLGPNVVYIEGRGCLAKMS